MRTSTSSRHGPWRPLVTSALSVPLGVVLLGGTAFAAPPGDAGQGADRSASAGSSSAGAEGAATKGEAKGQENKAENASAGQNSGTQKSGTQKSGTQKSGATATSPSQAKKSAPAAGSSSKPTKADTSSPQPLSKADQNGTGANPGTSCAHAYCSTRDGSPSGNGVGDGKATGKPCAGCVGKADNKNPPGQAPDGTDHNNGYECDGNQGIGKTNPAHTGCVEVAGQQLPPPPPAPCVPDGAAGPDAEDCEPVRPPTRPTVVTTSSPDGDVLGESVVRPFAPTAAPQPRTLVSAAVTPTALAATTAAATPTVLPFTGGPAAAMAAQIALLLLALGAALVRVGRTRRTAARR